MCDVKHAGKYVDTDERVAGQCPDTLTEKSEYPYYIPRVYDNTLYVPLTVSEPTLDHLVEKFGATLKRLLVNDFL